MQITEKAVYADFLHLTERPDVFPGKLSIPLSGPHNSPDLLKLHEGEHVLLIDPGSFHAKGRVHIIEQNRSVWYYGILEEEPQEDEEQSMYSLFA